MRTTITQEQRSVTFSQIDPKTYCKKVSAEYLWNKLWVGVPCDVSVYHQRSCCYSSPAPVFRQLHLFLPYAESRKYNAQKNTQFCFAALMPAATNLTTDGNLVASLRQWETDPLFDWFKVYPNIELFAEHNLNSGLESDYVHAKIQDDAKEICICKHACVTKWDFFPNTKGSASGL